MTTDTFLMNSLEMLLQGREWTTQRALREELGRKMKCNISTQLLSLAMRESGWRVSSRLISGRITKIWRINS